MKAHALMARLRALVSMIQPWQDRAWTVLFWVVLVWAVFAQSVPVLLLLILGELRSQRSSAVDQDLLESIHKLSKKMETHNQWVRSRYDKVRRS